MKPQYHFINDSSSEDEPVFTTLGTSIDEAFGVDLEDDVDECEEDDYGEDDYE